MVINVFREKSEGIQQPRFFRTGTSLPNTERTAVAPITFRLLAISIIKHITGTAVIPLTIA